MQGSRPSVRGFYWRENQLVGNLGDALAPILLDALGYELSPRTRPDATVLNPGRCLIVIGSLLNDYDLPPLGPSIDVWGCGWKGIYPSRATLATLRIHAVRGPHTIARLGLPAGTPLGDPVLLLPRLTMRLIPPHGRTVVVPHISRARLLPASQRRRLTGCDELVSPHVIQTQRLGRAGWLRSVLGLGKTWLRQGQPPRTPWSAVERIAGADFVLTGSLHGAILAQAYGVPWSAYHDGYIDHPAKWLDWAAFLGIELEFVSTLAEGRQWWQSKGRRGAIRDLAPLLNAFPYPLRNDVWQRFNRRFD